MKERLGVAALLLTLAALSPAWADESKAIEPQPETKDATIPPPPPGYDGKRPIGLQDYKRKKERGFFTGLPLFNFDTNTGFGGGARVFYFWNGDRENPLFAYTPYLHRVFAQAFVTTGGLQFHWLDWDAPAIGGTAYRARAQLIFMRNTRHPFYGIGSDSLRDLTFTGAGQSFQKFADYDDALQLQPDGTTLARYNAFDFIRPIGVVGLERTFLNGMIRPLVGVGITYSDINDYTGEQVTARGPNGDVEATQGPTLLREQCDLGRVVGCDGGWDNFLRLAVSLDTRDFEPDPNGGIFADMALDLGTVALGSEYDYARFMISGRYFHSILPSMTDLVFASRATFQTQSKGVPFFSLPTISFTEDPRSGLGGLRTMRGFRQERFIGRHLTLLNLELRWTFHRLQVLNQKFSLGLVGFSDIGRVYDRLDDLTLRGMKAGYGGGLRIIWNLATIITVDYGLSEEDTGLYINFHHQF